MKREYFFVYGWGILTVLLLWSCTTNYNNTYKLEAKCNCDTSELVKVRKELQKSNGENAKLRNDLYWVVKERNELREQKKNAFTEKRDVTYIKTMDDTWILTDRIFGDKK